MTCATDSTIPNSARNSSSRQSNATESAPPETATAKRSPARIDPCFRIVFNSRSASPCTEKWYRNQYPVPSCQSALIRGWELTLRSPRIAHRAQLHLAYSNQVAYAGGAITGGLTDGATNLCDPSPGLCALDHDQRNTLNIGADVSLPWRSYASTNIYYGSGFSNAFQGQPYSGGYLPGHTTFDLSLGKDFGERVSASLNALNVANRRIELDNSTTFGGFHWNNPREIFIELRYRFHY